MTPTFQPCSNARHGISLRQTSAALPRSTAGSRVFRPLAGSPPLPTRHVRTYDSSAHGPGVNGDHQRDRASERVAAEASSSSSGVDGPVDDRIRQALLRQVARSAAKELSRDTKAVIGFISQGANVDAAYLRKRRRSRWWSRVARSKLEVPIKKLKLSKTDGVVKILSKMLPLGVIFFATSFNLTILQNLRDALIVTSSGAEVLPFLSAFCVLPASILFFMYYSFLIQVLRPKVVYYVTTGTLVAIYALFASTLYPMHEQIHLYGVGEAMRAALPAGLHGLATLVQNWSFSLFFCFAEIWGSVCISLLFWGLANDVCSVDEAKTIYPLMGMAANVGLIVSGTYMKWAGQLFGSMASNTQALLQLYTATMVGMMGLMFVFKGYIDRTFLSGAAEEAEEKERIKMKKKKKKNKSFKENLEVLAKSPKIRNLALLVMCYSVAHRLFEFSWKGQLRTLYPTMIEYQGVLANVSIGTGWATMIMMLLGRFVFQYLGWGFAAQATPAVMFLSGGFFFFASLAPQLTGFLPLGGFDPKWLLIAGALAGCVTQVFARSSKFSLFDPAKEMVYIEMTKEEKNRGKAAVDLIGAQLGKSGGAWITQAMLLLTGTLTNSLPFVMAAFTGIILVWIQAVWKLEADMKQTEEKREQDLAEEERIRDEKYKDESKLWEAGSATQGGDSGREGASTVRVGSAPA